MKNGMRRQSHIKNLKVKDVKGLFMGDNFSESMKSSAP